MSSKVRNIKRSFSLETLKSKTVFEMFLLEHTVCYAPLRLTVNHLLLKPNNRQRLIRVESYAFLTARQDKAWFARNSEKKLNEEDNVERLKKLIKHHL